MTVPDTLPPGGGVVLHDCHRFYLSDLPDLPRAITRLLIP